MLHAFFRFYGALNDFLPPGRRRTTLMCEFRNRASVKDLIEALGIPHPEVERLVVDGELVDFRYLVGDGDRIAAYPPFHTLDLGDTGTLVRPHSGTPHFVADVHLGRLAAYLRLAGFDTWYRNDAPDAELAAVAAGDKRVLLTRDVELLKRSMVTRGYYVRHTQPGRQLVEVLRRFECVVGAQPFTRCPRCNGLLRETDKVRVAHLVPPRARASHERFSQCAGCAAVYWQGSHYERIQQFLDVAFMSAALTDA